MTIYWPVHWAGSMPALVAWRWGGIFCPYSIDRHRQIQIQQSALLYKTLYTVLAHRCTLLQAVIIHTFIKEYHTLYVCMGYTIHT